MIAQVLVGVAVGYWLGRSNSNNDNTYISKKENDSDASNRREKTRISRNPFRIPVDFGLIAIALSVLSNYAKSWNRRTLARSYANKQIEEVQDASRFIEEEECCQAKEGRSNDSNCDDDETTSCATTTSTTSVPLLETTITTTTSISTTVSQSNNTIAKREGTLRMELKRTDDDISKRQSTVPIKQLPKHIAVIMDGNRRYGLEKYNDKSRGHWDGSSKLIEFAKWCLAEQIPILTVYAFSTENWNRSKSEIDTLMEIFITHCDELRIESQNRGIRVLVLSTDTSKVSRWPIQKKQSLRLSLSLSVCVCVCLP